MPHAIVRRWPTLFAVVLLTLAGCATRRDHVGYCRVLQYGGALGAPEGLVSLDPALEAKLRAQLPKSQVNDYLCWYATGTEIVVTPRASGIGTVFRRDGDEWILSDEPGYIMWLPPL